MKKVITKIEIQKKDKNRVNVFLNEEFAFACSTELIYCHRLEKGREIDVNVLKEIIEEDNYIKAKNSALRFIEKNYKTENEVFAKLTKLEYNSKTSSRVIKFLKEYGFVDDIRYTDMFIREKIKSWGKSKIEYMLIKKGIPQEIINEALDKVTYDSQLEIAEKLGEKKYYIIIKSEKDEKKIYNKISNYLLSKGYDYSIINSVLKKIIQLYEVTKSQNKELTQKYDIDDIDELRNTAMKRYNIIIKSEKDNVKIYRKLGQYLLRRGYQWEEIKRVLKELIED
ncbi:recombination regulator RecX [Clostridium sp. MB40-C1]|uniref:recombination regulator RecX n=1 Tax=Clostridium sp. MB40-C1 TaxID=3070996 RepID=UPI0027E1811E|nr:recombination regulator RecX [Clostridium sp. MB40-C1]WMJ81057.1 recombination regulator RecX [Clostridium sp. MB40-C1]